MFCYALLTMAAFHIIPTPTNVFPIQNSMTKVRPMTTKSLLLSPMSIIQRSTHTTIIYIIVSFHIMASKARKGWGSLEMLVNVWSVKLSTSSISRVFLTSAMPTRSRPTW
ncbi:unnamed protein product [Rhizophagus irregularis]|nr:unnamed protein product [Rhizophagus irregularis]CAB4484422.1 unnamed protein product [Rhizophagus irregularis]